MTVNGFGMDNIGAFTLDGFYSSRTRRVAFTQKYRGENQMHPMDANRQVIVQLVWNEQKQMFQGKWYDQRMANRGNFQVTYDE